MTEDKITNYDQVITRNGYGYFPNLDKIPNLLHGFKWGNPENIFYTREPGYPDNQAIIKVKERVVIFLSELKMSNPPQTVIFAALPELDNICYLDQDSISKQQTLQDRGFYLESGAVFTTIKGLSIYAGLGDCSFTMFYSEGTTPLIGLIHAGRAELTKQSPKKTILEVINKYNLNLKEIKLGILPYLGQEHHTVTSERFNQLPTGRDWEQFSKRNNEVIHLDMGAYLLDQYDQVGIPKQNIEIYNVDTYTSAAQGLCFSHRYDMNHNQSTHRMGLAIQLI